MLREKVRKGRKMESKREKREKQSFSLDRKIVRPEPSGRTLEERKNNKSWENAVAGESITEASSLVLGRILEGRPHLIYIGAVLN